MHGSCVDPLDLMHKHISHKLYPLLLQTSKIFHPQQPKPAFEPPPQIIMGSDKQPEAPADESESKIPPLNPEDPLLGLTDEQIKESLSTFGKNEVSIIA